MGSMNPDPEKRQTTQAHILVVDDEPNIAEIVSLYLRRAGFRVTLAWNGHSALQALMQEQPDLVVLDLMLPQVDGIEIARRLRREGDTPIIMLTAKREEADRILGFEVGADDYVIKPFSPQELVGRVRAVLRRTQLQFGGETQQKPIRYGNLRIDPNTFLIHIGKREISLTGKEFDLLWFLAAHPRQVFKRAQLLERVWGETDYLDPSTVTVHIRRLREKLEPDPSQPRYICTVWGVGYKFEP